MANDHGWSRARVDTSGRHQQPRDFKRRRPLAVALATTIFILQASVAFATGFFVAPGGDDSNAGTIDRPWRTLGVSMNRLLHGDTLYLREGTYFERPRIEMSGTAAAPIVIRSYPGERGIIDSGYPASQTPNSGAWELVNASRGEYRSTFSASSGRIYGFVGGVLNYGNGRVGLIPYKSQSHFNSTSDQQGSSIYVGPGTFYKSGRIHIRLAKTSDLIAAEARYGQVFAGDPPNPNDYPIYLSTASYTLRVEGSYLVFRDITVHQAKRAIYMGSNVHDIRFEGMTVWAGNRAISTPKSGVHHVVVTRSRIYGDYPYWLFWSDMGDSPKPADAFRNTVIDLRNGTHDWEFSYNHIQGAGHDLVGTHDNEYNLFFHHNRIENAGDDAFELEGTSNVGHIQIYENYIANCFTAFAPGQSTSSFDGPLLIYRNIVASLRNPPVNREEGINSWNGGGRFGYEYMFKHSRGSGDESRNVHYYQNTLLMLNSPGDGINITPTDSRDSRLANNLMIMVNGVVTGPFQLDPGLILDGNLYWKANTQDNEPLLDSYDTVADFNAATGHEASGLGATPQRGTNPGFATFELGIVDRNAAEWQLTAASEQWNPQHFLLDASSPARGAAVPLPPHPNLGTLPDTRAFGDIGALPFGSDPAEFSQFPFDPTRSPWDTLTVNLPPEVDAGLDQTIILPEAAALDGTISDDAQPGGSVLTSVWRLVAGPFVPTFADSHSVDTEASFPDSGTYVLSLTASDGDKSAADSVTIIARRNEPPLVEAGPDQAITLPGGAVLDGTVSDATVPLGQALYQAWRLVSGPFQPSFADSNAIDTQVSFPDTGRYALSLNATDGALAAADTVTITVSIVPNAPPEVSTGPDQTITMPDAAALTGSVSDDGLPEGSSLSIRWRLASGPAPPMFADSTVVTTTVSFSSTGIYLLSLNASDGDKNAADSVTITVHPIPNTAPTVDAGPDQSITLPNAASLDGTVDDDGRPSGSTLMTAWRLVSGPFAPSFGDSNAVDTPVSFPDTGTYVLSLNAHDGELGASDTMRIIASNVVAVSASIEVQIGFDNDDAEERLASGSVSLSSSDIEMVDDRGRPQRVGLRFRNVAIPAGALITDASIQFQVDEDDSGPVNLTIQGQKTGNAPAFTASSGDLTERPLTGAAVPWEPLAWSAGDAGPAQRTPNLKDIIQEIVDQGTWDEGNALAIIVTGSGERTAESHEGNPGAAARLFVDFDTFEGPPPPPPPNTAPNVEAGPDQQITLPASATLAGLVSDDGQPSRTLTQVWRFVSGPAAPAFSDSNALNSSVSFVVDGTYVLRLVASDGELSASDSMTIVVLPQPAGTTTFDVRVADDDDDAEERPGGSVSLSSSDLELTTDGSNAQTIGMRFLNLQIQRGATVLNAHVQFTVDESKNADGTITIRGQHGDAARFSSASGDVTSRPRTVAFKTWTTPAWTNAGDAGPDQQTPDLTAIIQEIVSRNDWSSGFDLAIIIDGTGTRTAESHDGAPDRAPLLHVEIAGASAAQQAPRPSDARPSAEVLELSATVVPNPMRHRGALHFTTVRGGPVHIELFDLQGRHIELAFNEEFLPPGQHTVVLGTRSPLSPGLYMYRLRAPSGVRSGRFVILE